MRIQKLFLVSPGRSAAVTMVRHVLRASNERARVRTGHAPCCCFTLRDVRVQLLLLHQVATKHAATGVSVSKTKNGTVCRSLNSLFFAQLLQSHSPTKLRVEHYRHIIHSLYSS